MYRFNFKVIIVKFPLLMLILLTFKSNAQSMYKNKSDSIFNNSKASIDFFYGNILYQKSFGQQMNSFKYSKFGNPLQTVGISITYPDIVLFNILISSSYMAYSQIVSK